MNVDALVIGAGPAGLAAADSLSSAGRRVVVAEAKPSVARKLLMAGKSGLNVTKSQDFESFMAAFGDAENKMRPFIEGFGPDQVEEWCENLGQSVFTGSSGRVFPVSMKASPLLRAWLHRLDEREVVVRTRWRWCETDGSEFVFATPNGSEVVSPRICILALGGASWSRLGSDGKWASQLTNAGFEVAAFKPSNAGLIVDWTKAMKPHFGEAIKGAVIYAGDAKSNGEFVISYRGLEGGGIYEVFSKVRDGADLIVDLKPAMTEPQVAARLKRVSAKSSIGNRLRKALGLDGAKRALLLEFCQDRSPENLAAAVKSLHIRHDGPRPIDEAISTAGGLSWNEVNGDLMIRGWPGVYACGEMLDWEAPTGGYLLTACLATGFWAGQRAAQSDQSINGPFGTIPNGLRSSEGEK